MYKIGGAKGYVEKDNEYLVYFYTNADILDPKVHDEWWEQFESLTEVGGFGKKLNLFRDPDQRDGQHPQYKYLTIYGFKGDADKMKKAINKLKLPKGNCVILYKAIAPLYEKKNMVDEDEEHIFMALTNSMDGIDKEFNEWYNEHHVPEIVRIRCYRSSRRFKKQAVAGDAFQFDYLALYRFGGTPENMRHVLRDYASAGGNVYMKIHPYKPVDYAWVYSEITPENEGDVIDSFVEAPKKKIDFYEALRKRRSVYVTSAASPISDEKLVDIIKEITNISPSSFNSQSSRVVVLLGKEHEDFWNIVMETLRKITPKEAFQPTYDKIRMLSTSHGTILYYEDMEIVERLQKSFPLYKDNFPIWAEQSSAMLQFSIWTALAVEGLGATLQHYNPIIDKDVAKRFNIPSTWKLIGQMPFGGIGAKAEKIYHLPLEEKVYVMGEDK